MYVCMHYKEQIRNIFWIFIILTHPSVLQELDFIIYTRGRGSWYFRSSSRGGLANSIPIARMGHLISDPKFKIPTSPCPLCEFLRTPLGRALNIQQICQKKDQYNKNNLKAVFCLLELLVYIQLVTCTRLSCNAQFSYWFPLFTLFVEDLWKHSASKFFDEIDIFSKKMSLKWRRKIDRISWYYWICLE